MVSWFCEACRIGPQLIGLDYNAHGRWGAQVEGSAMNEECRCHLLLEYAVIMFVPNFLSAEFSTSIQAHSSEVYECILETAKDESMS